MKTILILTVLFFSETLLATADEIIMNLPLTRSTSPISQGQFLKGRIILNGRPSQEIQLISNTGGHPPNLNDVKLMGRSSFSEIGVQVGLLSRLDLIFDVPSKGSLGYGARFQILGAPGRVQPDGELSLSIICHYSPKISFSDGVSSSNIFTGDREGREWAGTTQIYDCGAVIGYSISEKLILFGGIHHSKAMTSGEYHQYDTGSSIDNRYSLDGEGGTTGISLGTEYKFLKKKSHWFLRAQFTASNVKWSELDTQTVSAIGFAGGWAWH